MDNQNGTENSTMNLWQRIIGIFVSPVKTIDNLREHPKFLGPMLIFFLVGIGMFFMVGPVTAITTEEISRICIERYGVDLTAMSTAVLDQSVISAIAAATTAVVTVFSPYVTAFFMSLLLLIFSKITKGPATLKQYYSVYLHIYIITTLGGLLISFFIMLFGSSTNVLSLAILIPGGNFTMMSYNALSAISVFSIWEAILVFICMRQLNEFSVVKSAIAAILVFVVGGAILAYSQYSAILTYDALYNLQFSIPQ